MPVNQPKTADAERKIRGAERDLTDAEQNLTIDEESPEEQQPSEGFHEAIARLAYAIWQERGCPNGTDVEDWLEAERQLTKKQLASTA